MVPINLLKRYTLCGTANLIRDDMYYPDDVPCYKTGSRYENCSSTEITVASISNPCGRYCRSHSIYRRWKLFMPVCVYSEIPVIDEVTNTPQPSASRPKTHLRTTLTPALSASLHYQRRDPDISFFSLLIRRLHVLPIHRPRKARTSRACSSPIQSRVVSPLSCRISTTLRTSSGRPTGLPACPSCPVITTRTTPTVRQSRGFMQPSSKWI